ncbi:MAG: tRNA-(ms[2]io[6]A)-hydroxylase [Gammaproteobacteria bacterium]|nr:MAG: tRNA-(ms[2]io[6]A)-hydroxylase [Gammaproteobacteria bacterium]
MLDEINAFLGAPTPDRWIEQACEPVHAEILLVDHANCEKKAAATALHLMHRYCEHISLCMRLSKLAREELRHFEQVVRLMEHFAVPYRKLGPARYAAGLHAQARNKEPGRLEDMLIIGAFIEARSCERFARLAPHVEPELGRFYTGLLESEGRHYRIYLDYAREVSAEDLAGRIQHFREVEARLITEPDTQFRFHSGPVCEDQC